jgi:hypothetical protein
MHKVYYQNVLIHTWHFVMRRAIILACQKYWFDLDVFVFMWDSFK